VEICQKQKYFVLFTIGLFFSSCATASYGGRLGYSAKGGWELDAVQWKRGMVEI
jgi:hypothetical protein